MNNKILKFGSPHEKNANTGTRMHGTRNAREGGNTHENPLKLKTLTLKTHVKARSKVLRFPQVPFEQHPTKLSFLSAKTEQFFSW